MKNSTENNSMEVTFWGTRGTLPAAGSQFLKTGGNTNCVELTCGEDTVIFDAGTGIRQLGSNLLTEKVDQNVHLLLTHAHYDHVEGIPFFAPFFKEEKKIDVYCGELDGSSSTKETVLNLMRRPYFPVSPEVFVADVAYKDISQREAFSIGENVLVKTAPLNHPGGATGYRVEFANKVFAYVTDTEHVPEKPDENVLELIQDVDLFIYDCSLTDAEYPEFEGFGHSTYEEAMRLCVMANAKSFMAFHHMPFRVDSEIDQLENFVRNELPSSGVAREGMVLSL